MGGGGGVGGGVGGGDKGGRSRWGVEVETAMVTARLLSHLNRLGANIITA